MYITKAVCILCMAVLTVTACADQNKTSKPMKEGAGKPVQTTGITCESCLSCAPSDFKGTASGKALTLKEVISLTLLNNPELKAFSFEQRAAEARQLQAGLWPNPELDIEVENFGGSGDLKDFDGAETTISLSQVIELGNKSQKRQHIAAIEKEIVDWEYKTVRLQVLGGVTKAYINVLAAQEKLHSVEHLFDLSKQSLETVSKRVQAGKDSPLEETRAEVATANIKIELQQAQRNVDFTRKQLVSYWCSNHTIINEVKGDLGSISKLPDLEQLLNALKMSPAYLRWNKEVAKSWAAVELEKSKSTPDITISAGMKRFNETNDNALVVGISIPLPIFDSNQGGRREAAFNLCKAREEQRATNIRLQNEFYQTYQELSNSFSKATSLKNEVLPAGKKVYEAATIAYREGKTDFISVLDAQRTFFELRNEYIESLVSYHLAKIDIESSIGLKKQWNQHN